MNRPAGTRVQGNPAPEPGGETSVRDSGPAPHSASSSGRAWSLVHLAFLLPILGGTLVLVRGSASEPLDPTAPTTLVAVLLAALGWLGTLAVARRVPDSPALIASLIAGCVSLRLAWLFVTPGLSDDLERYVWEGGLVSQGVSPYDHAPEAPELTGFRVLWRETWEGVNHREVAAAYPPGVQLANALVVGLAGGPARAQRARLALRAFYALCDVGVALALLRLLALRGRPLALASAWAWSPLVGLESAGSGHLDALGVLCLVAALVACARRRAGRGVALLVLGGATKILPLALLPFALRESRRPALAALQALGVAAAVLGAFALWTGAFPVLAGLNDYALRWESFSLVHRWIEPLLGERLARDGSWNDPRRLVRGFELLLWLALGFLAWRRRLDLPRTAGLLVAGFLLLTPTLHPWYLLWIVPFLALRPSLAWTALVAAAPLLYWPLEGWRTEAVWVEPGWLWPGVGGGFLGLLLLEQGWRRWRSR